MARGKVKCGERDSKQLQNFGFNSRRVRMSILSDALLLQQQLQQQVAYNSFGL